MRTIAEIHIHHTENPHKSDFKKGNHLSLIKGMKHFHVTVRGFSDYAYHFTLFPDGIVIPGRDIEKTPASIIGRNKNAIAIALLGNFDYEQLEDPQKTQLIQLCHKILKEYGLENQDLKKTIIFHREYANKTCPGTMLSKPWLIEEIAKKIKG